MVENYINELITKKIPVKIFLTNGTMLTGKILEISSTFTILDKCLIFNDKIISIVPL